MIANPLYSFDSDALKVGVYGSRLLMGQAAANDIAAALSVLLDAQEEVNIIFAAAPSQREMLAALVQFSELDWHRVNAFHMDEYIGLEKNAPQRFGYFLQQAIFDHLPFGSVHLINGNATDILSECARYAALLEAHPVDLVCMGIGENTHIAFNDPHVADFNDPVLVKRIVLDAYSRKQQVNDGCFTALEAVPTEAITLTVPALMQADRVFCVVPGPTKSTAVVHTLQEKISPAYPSTILRSHHCAVLYLDMDSAAYISSSAR
jgi:glucosamine-6-phosphate deaminase